MVAGGTPPPATEAVRALGARLAPDEVLNLEDLRLSRELDAQVGEDGHQLFTVRLELLGRTPDFADTHVVGRPKRNVDVKSGRIGPYSGLFHTPQAFVVLLPCDIRRWKRTTMLMSPSSMLGVEPTLLVIGTAARRDAIRSVERDAFTPAAGYEPRLLIGGIELRDRVWLDRGVADQPGTYSRMRPRSRKPTVVYTRSAISVDCRLAVWQPRAAASCASSAVSAVPRPRRRARSSVPRL